MTIGACETRSATAGSLPDLTWSARAGASLNDVGAATEEEDDDEDEVALAAREVVALAAAALVVALVVEDAADVVLLAALEEVAAALVAAAEDVCELLLVVVCAVGVAELPPQAVATRLTSAEVERYRKVRRANRRWE
jgi:hypothetical protein